MSGKRSHRGIGLRPVDTYGHLIPGANRGAVDRLDDEVGTQPSATQAQPDTDVEDLDVGDDADLLRKRLRPQASAGGKSARSADRERAVSVGKLKGPTRATLKEVRKEAPAAASERRSEPPRSGGASAQRGGDL